MRMRTNIATMTNLPCLCKNNPNCLYKLCLGWVSCTRYRVHSLHTTHNPRTLFTTSSSTSVFLRSSYPQNTEQYIHARNWDVRYLHSSRKTFKFNNSHRPTSRWNNDKRNSDGGDHASWRSDVGESGEQTSETSEDTEKLVHRYMMERLAVENDKLSRLRNTYIMTLAGVAVMQLQLAPLKCAIGAVAITTSQLNLLVATVLYITNNSAFWRSGTMSTAAFGGRVLFIVLHFILWSMVLVFIFPDGKLIDEELRKYIEEEP